MIIILLALLLAAPSQQVPSGAAKSSKKTDVAQTQHRGSDSLPVAVRLLNTGKSDKEAAQDSQRIADSKKSETRNLGIALFLAFATAVQAIALFITIDDAKKTTRIQLRGYVFFHERVKWAPTGLNIRFKNAGQTPVRDVQVVGYVSGASPTHIGPLPMTDRGTEDFRATMGPQGELDVHFKSPLLRATMEDSVRAIATGTTIYVHGEVKYTDAYDIPRSTKFRYRLEGGDLRNCTEGNSWE
jgi:hypothetical protein